ncbi:hypothetical protein HVE01_24130 [Vreelandella venusta]|nr:hypothetical protein HVE01_24130 [Halomonas venusta]
MPNTPMLKLTPASITHMRLISLILAPRLAHGNAYIARYVWISMDLYEGFATLRDSVCWLLTVSLRR